MLSSIRRHGVYFGVRGKSGEIIVADDHGVWKARTLQRRPIDERWVGENANIVKLCPRTNKEKKDMDNDFSVAIKISDEELDKHVLLTSYILLVLLITPSRKALLVIGSLGVRLHAMLTYALMFCLD